jgi:hypothetical protein
MAGKVTSSKFVGAFAHLNGTETISASREDIVRSLLTVGYPSRKLAKAQVGPWRARMLHAMATGYLDRSLRTTQYFRNLEQSEKVGVSFLLGEAFTHWYAQEKMKLTHLLHVQSLKSYGCTAITSTRRPKPGSSQPAKNSRPDFIGFKGQDTHVFESKGRMRNPTATTKAKALGQVSTIKRINGRSACTRSATFFMLKAAGVEGTVIDPPAGWDGFDITFDPFEAKQQAYRLFLDGPLVPMPIDGGFMGVEIMPDVFFGVDKLVLEIMKEPPATLVERQSREQELTTILEERWASYSNLRGSGISAGRDGLLLIDRTVLPRQRRRVIARIPS